MTPHHRDYRGAIVERVLLDQAGTPVAVLTWPTRNREIAVEEHISFLQIKLDALHYNRTAQQKLERQAAAAQEGRADQHFTSFARETEKALEHYQAARQILRQLDHSERYLRV